MYKVYKGIFYLLTVTMLAACSKDESRAVLPEGSVIFKQATGKDTLEMPVSILKDSTMVFEIQAALAGTLFSEDHFVSFAVDSTKMLDYRTRFGNATLLPASSYLFYKPTTRIAAGDAVSEVAMLNIGAQTKLTEYSTYVLPLVIKSVDGKADVASTRVLYYVFKTGKPLFVNKTGWTIAGSSSQNSTANAPATLLDANNLTTYWATNIQQQMPQWVSINFNKEITFTALTYYLPTALRYPTLGGYPTLIRIETSMNGTTWVNRGEFTGNVKDNMQMVEIGTTTARYLRFTSLAAARYNSLYDAVFISGISLTP